MCNSTKNTIIQALAERILILDGAMGTCIQKFEFESAKIG